MSLDVNIAKIMPGVTPIKLDLNDCGLDEDQEEIVVDEEAFAPKRKRVKRVSVLWAAGLSLPCIAMAGLLFFLFESGVVQSIGKPRLDGFSAGAQGDSEAGSGGHIRERAENKNLSQDNRTETYAPVRRDSEVSISNESLGEVKHYNGVSYYILHPVTVSSYSANGKIRILISLAFEADKSTATVLFENGVLIKDELAAVIRSANGETLRDQASASNIRYILHRRIEALLPEAEIKSIWVQEYAVF